MDSSALWAKTMFGRLCSQGVCEGVLVIGQAQAAMIYGPMAATLLELFRARIRNISMSLPYRIGNGWRGGLVPTTAFMIVAVTGDIYAGILVSGDHRSGNARGRVLHPAVSLQARYPA